MEFHFRFQMSTNLAQSTFTYLQPELLVGHDTSHRVGQELHWSSLRQIGTHQTCCKTFFLFYVVFVGSALSVIIRSSSEVSSETSIGF
jgi:hypothetical protein